MEEKNAKNNQTRVEDVLSYGGIFVWDSSSLCAPGFKKCVQTHFATIQKYGDRFIVPSFEKSKLDNPNGEAAKMVLDRNLFAVSVQEDGDSYEAFIKAMKEKKKDKLNIIVNDSSRKFQILNAGKSAGGYLYFHRVNENGEIEMYTAAKKQNTGETKPTGDGEKSQNNRFQGNRPPKVNPQNSNSPKSNLQNNKPQGGFMIKMQPEKVPYEPIVCGKELVEGDSVVDSKGKKYSLVKQEATNPGAVTYSTNEAGLWVKLYSEKTLNTYTKAKVERMLSQRMEYPGLCWPVGVALDDKGVFRGYFIREFKGIPLHLCIFKRAGIDTYFPNWQKLDLCELAITILKTIEFLHKKNVLLGCINPAAIRVVSSKEVYFTETDNYQVDGFPTMIHNISFTAPELLDKKVYLATKANENFAVAELVFMLMMPGKTPYAVGGDESPEKLIKDMKFPYANGRVHGNYALPGMWRFMWSHLSSLKGAFYNTFQNGEKYNNPQERRDVRYWLTVLDYYKKDLLSPTDPESLKIYPRTFKRSKEETFHKCNYCGIEHPRFYFYNNYFEDYRICNSCIDKRSEVSFECKACGKTYYYTNRLALFHKNMKKQDSEWQNQKYCRDCKKKTLPCAICGKEWPFYHLRNHRCPDCNQEYLSSTYKMLRCRDCGRSFAFTYKDYEYYMKKGYSEPSRCQDCRNRNKSGGVSPTPYLGSNQTRSTGMQGSSSTQSSSGSQSGSSKRGGLLGWLFGE